MRLFIRLGWLLTILLPVSAAEQTPGPAGQPDNRIVVELPDPIKQALRERMRRNLSDIQRIQKALADAEFNKAADVAEYSLGLSSLGPHNTRQASYMPDAMRQMGNAMHGASSRVALAAQEEDTVKALGLLAEVTALCVGCHATYRAK
jgi:hypothetical protein